MMRGAYNVKLISIKCITAEVKTQKKNSCINFAYYTNISYTYFKCTWEPS